MQITPYQTPSSPAPSAPATKASPPASGPSFAEALEQASEQTSPSAANRTKLPGKPLIFLYGEDGVVTVSEMRSALTTAKADYQKRLSAALSKHGVKASGPEFQLTSTATGQVQVVGDHPDKARIEAAFASDGKLVNLFHQVNSLAAIRAHAEEHAVFMQAYEKDPEAAVAQFAHLFNTETKATITHRWGADGLELLIDTTRVPRMA